MVTGYTITRKTEATLGYIGAKQPKSWISSNRCPCTTRWKTTCNIGINNPNIISIKNTFTFSSLDLFADWVDAIIVKRRSKMSPPVQHPVLQVYFMAAAKSHQWGAVTLCAFNSTITEIASVMFPKVVHPMIRTVPAFLAFQWMGDGISNIGTVMNAINMNAIEEESISGLLSSSRTSKFIQLNFYEEDYVLYLLAILYLSKIDTNILWAYFRRLKHHEQIHVHRLQPVFSKVL